MKASLRRVLLVGWDAADWKAIRPLIAEGKMPHLARLVAKGTSGPIATLHPPLSPMLWTSIATGKRPFKHGIHGFSEPTPDGRGIQPVSSRSRTSKALWNILNQNGLRSVVVGWWPSHPAEPINGVMVSDRYADVPGPLTEGWPLDARAIHPSSLAAVLEDLRVHPDQVTPPMAEEFIPLASEIDQDQDKRLGGVLRILAEMMTIDAATFWLLDHERWDFFAVYYNSLDHFCHGFMKYHPPRQSWVSKRDYEVYHNVVSMAYQYHDRSLGTLLDKAGEDVTVVLLSDHGFHPDHLRPSTIPDIPAGPAVEHRDLGIFVVSGPGVKRGELVHGVSLLDIAPTILTLYGLPVGEDMDGKVVSRAFLESPAVTYTLSWEALPGADGQHPLQTRPDPIAGPQALEQMIALGYIERLDANPEAAVTNTVRELRYNLGEAYQDADRHLEAYGIFAELYAADRDQQRFAMRLFVSCQALGMLDEMRRIVHDLECGQGLIADYLKAQVLIAEKRYREALEKLERVPGTLVQRADLYMRLRRWGHARESYASALALDPDNALAHVGLCRVALSRREYGVAAESALEAIQRIPYSAVGHFLLGRALAGLQDYTRAAAAFREGILINPHFPEAHVRLAALLHNHLGDSDSGREYRRLAHSMRMSPRSGVSLPTLDESLVVVTGLPRSGTSMTMQMLAAGGFPVLTDELRTADEDNPRGYLEFEPVKNLVKDSRWLREARGKAVKIVAPLLSALPAGLPCRVILCERDLDEVLDSQEKMLARRTPAIGAEPERRRMLKAEYIRILARANALLVRRPGTQVLVVHYRSAISDPVATAEKVSRFLGGGLEETRMAAAVEPALHRNRAGE